MAKESEARICTIPKEGKGSFMLSGKEQFEPPDLVVRLLKFFVLTIVNREHFVVAVTNSRALGI